MTDNIIIVDGIDYTVTYETDNKDLSVQWTISANNEKVLTNKTKDMNNAIKEVSNILNNN